MNELPHVVVVTVLWKSAEFMPALFEGLVGLDYPHDKLTMHFVENGKGDGSLNAVREQMARFEGRLPPIKIHEPGENTGFAGGNNLVMRDAVASGIPYVYLLNHDAAFEPQALREAIAVAESDAQIGSVQSLLVLMQNPDEVNSTGNAIHYLGMGYCNGYHLRRDAVPQDVRRIAYASGAAELIPTRVLKEVGYFDETLWLYHEDLDLGWRFLLAGYRNVLAPKSVVRHRYDFSRSISKWYWMERNRIAVVFKNYHLLTIILLLPQLVIADLALFAFSLKGGWWREKLRASAWFCTPKAWAFLLRGREQIAKIRRVSDNHILSFFSPVVAYQEFEDPFVVAVVNPVWRLLFAILRVLVIW